MGRLNLGSEQGMSEYNFRTKSPGVDLLKVQDQFTWDRLILGSELGMNEFRFRTKSLGVDLR